MLILMTIILGAALLVVGLYIYRNNMKDLDGVCISSLSAEQPCQVQVKGTCNKVFNDKNTLDESTILSGISKNDSKQALMSFTQLSQRSDKQIPVLGLPDKALFHIH